MGNGKSLFIPVPAYKDSIGGPVGHCFGEGWSGQPQLTWQRESPIRGSCGYHLADRGPIGLGLHAAIAIDVLDLL